MELFEFYKGKTRQGIKSKIGTFLNKHPLWNELKYTENIDEINNYSRELLANEFLEKEKSYIAKRKTKGLNEETLLEHITIYIDFLFPRSYFVQLGNDKYKYKGINSIYGLKYYYAQNYDLDIKMYGENNIEKYKQEYIQYNNPYKHLKDKELHNILLSDVFENGLYLRKEYENPFNRLTMLKLLHHFYYKKEFENVNEYVCDRDEYYSALGADLVAPYILDREIEIGDYVIHSSIKYIQEICDNNSLGLGKVYKKKIDGSCWVKVDFSSIGLSEWFILDELQAIDTTSNAILNEIRKSTFEEDKIEYSNHETIERKEKTYYELNKPYEKISDYKLYDLLKYDVEKNGYSLKSIYNTKFDRLEMLKLLHHFYYNEKFENYLDYVYKINEDIDVLNIEIKELIIDKPIEVGDYIVPKKVKHLAELFNSKNCILGQIRQISIENNVYAEIILPDLDGCVWLREDDIYIIDTTKHRELFELRCKLFNEEYTEEFLTNNDIEIEGIKLYLRSDLQYKEYYIHHKDDDIPVKTLNQDDKYILLREELNSNYYLIDKLTNKVYGNDRTVYDSIKIKQEALIHDTLFNLNNLKPFLINFYGDDYSEFIKNSNPTIKQLYFIGRILNDIYEKQFKRTKYKKFFNEFEIPFKANKIIRVPKLNKKMKLSSHLEVKNMIEFLDKFNKKDKKQLSEFKNLFILE